MSPVSTIDPPQGASASVVEPPADEKTRSVRVLTPPDVDPEMVVDEMPPFPVRPITVEQFEYLVEVGFFGDARVEMLDGFVVNKMTHGSLASTIISILGRILMRAIDEPWFVRVQLPVKCLRSEPEPDLSIVRGPVNRYLASHPTAADIPIVIEVSDSTLSKDRGAKLRTYARNAIREYWIVNCVDHQIEIYTEPTTDDGAPRYGSKTVLYRGDVATLVIEGQPPIEIPLATLFGE